MNKRILVAIGAAAMTAGTSLILPVEDTRTILNKARVSLRDAAGQRISWGALYRAIQAGASFSADEDGRRPLPGRSLAESGIQLERYARYMKVAGRTIRFAPASGDGTYRIKGQLRWNVVSDSLLIDRRLAAAE